MKGFEEITNTLDFVIKIKKECIQFYAELCDNMKSEHYQEIFKNFIEDENDILQILLNISANDFKSSINDSNPSINIKEYINPQINCLGLTDNEMLVLAINREIRSSNLFKILSVAALTRKLKKIFIQIRQIADKHEATLEVEYNRIIIPNEIT